MASAREKSLAALSTPEALVCAFVICSSCFLFACRSPSVADEGEASPLSLLGEGSLLYLAADARAHQDLVVSLLASSAGLPPQDAQVLAGRMGFVCVAVGGEGSFELACTARFPKRMTESRLAKSSSPFTKHKVAVEGFRGKKFTHTPTGLEVAFLDHGLLCAGESVEPMIEHFASAKPLDQSPRNEWLLGALDEPSIRFYSERPLEFLEAAVGFPEGVGGKLIESIAGSLMPSGEGYSVELYFRVASSRAVGALKAMLTLSLGSMGASVEDAGDSVLKVGGIELTAEEVASLLSHQRGRSVK